MHYMVMTGDCLFQVTEPWKINKAVTQQPCMLVLGKKRFNIFHDTSLFLTFEDLIICG